MNLTEKNMVFKGKDLHGYILDFDKNRNLVSIELPTISDINNADTLIFAPNEELLKWTQEHIKTCTSKDFTGAQFEYSFFAVWCCRNTNCKMYGL